jgi:putative endonuclease
MRWYHVYILTNDSNTVLYTGVTGNIARRIYQHKNQLIKGFTSKYNVHKLVYSEEYNSIYDAIRREKQIKGGSREKKLKLIMGINPDFRELRVQ